MYKCYLISIILIMEIVCPQDSLASYFEIVEPEYMVTGLVKIESHTGDFIANLGTNDTIYEMRENESVRFSSQAKYFAAVNIEDNSHFIKLFNQYGIIIGDWSRDNIGVYSYTSIKVSDFDGSLLFLNSTLGKIFLFHPSNQLLQEININTSEHRYINSVVDALYTIEGNKILVKVSHDRKFEVTDWGSKLQVYDTVSGELLWQFIFEGQFREGEDMVDWVVASASPAGNHVLATAEFHSIKKRMDEYEGIRSFLFNSEGELLNEYVGLDPLQPVNGFNEESNILIVKSAMGHYRGMLYIDLISGEIIDHEDLLPW